MQKNRPRTFWEYFASPFWNRKPAHRVKVLALAMIHRRPQPLVGAGDRRWALMIHSNPVLHPINHHEVLYNDTAANLDN